MKVIALYQVDCCCFVPQGCCYYSDFSSKQYCFFLRKGTFVNTQEKKTLPSAQGDVLEIYVISPKTVNPKGFSNTEEIHNIQTEQHYTGPKRILFCAWVIRDLGVFNPQTNTFVPLTTWQRK